MAWQDDGESGHPKPWPPTEDGDAAADYDDTYASSSAAAQAKQQEKGYHSDCAAVHPNEPYHRRARFELHKCVLALAFWV